MLFQDLISHIEIWDDWLIRYKNWVPRFIEEAKTKRKWEDWDSEVFKEYFEKSNNQCVSSLQQGYFSHNEQSIIKANWSSIAPFLKLISESQDIPLWDTYRELQDIIRKYTINNKRAATYRLIAGLQPKLLCTIVNEYDLRQLIYFLENQIEDVNIETKGDWYKDSHNICQLFLNRIEHTDPYNVITLPWQCKEYFLYNSSSKSEKSDNMKDESEEILSLLKYKKQIILQGPPGTGKTKLAKEIAFELAGDLKLTKSDILHFIKPETKIESAYDKLDYYIKEIKDETIHVINSEKGISTTSLDKIKNAFDQKVWKTGDIKSQSDSYSAAIARYIYEKTVAEQSQIIQFHPGYSYEDFVRGIISKPNEGGSGVIYEAENKILAKFADKALLSFNQANGRDSDFTEVKSNLERFISFVIEKIDVDGKFELTDNVYLFYVDEKKFKYKGDNWTAHPQGLNMHFSELEKIISLNQFSRAEINKNPEFNALTRQHATYFARLLERYQQFVKDNPAPTGEEVTLKNYVLIIDEINRANLSSVLGELIYALEYRGEAVEGMYKVGEKNELILPPNLYIIGTMNTADRSVGHIDYAIRRRFSFVDILPENLSSNDKIVFHDTLFKKVSEFFISNFDEYISDHKTVLKPSTNLSQEFKPKDVWIGHSYFIQKKEKDSNGKDILIPESRDIRLQYEIKPLLLEYVKDGILVGEGIEDAINELGRE